MSSSSDDLMRNVWVHIEQIWLLIPGFAIWASLSLRHWDLFWSVRLLECFLGESSEMQETLCLISILFRRSNSDISEISCDWESCTHCSLTLEKLFMAIVLTWCNNQWRLLWKSIFLHLCLFAVFAVVQSDSDQIEQFKVSLCLVSLFFDSCLMSFSFFTVCVWCWLYMDGHITLFRPYY